MNNVKSYIEYMKECMKENENKMFTKFKDYINKKPKQDISFSKQVINQVIGEEISVYKLTSVKDIDILMKSLEKIYHNCFDMKKAKKIGLEKLKEIEKKKSTEYRRISIQISNDKYYTLGKWYRTLGDAEAKIDRYLDYDEPSDSVV